MNNACRSKRQAGLDVSPEMSVTTKKYRKNGPNVNVDLQSQPEEMEQHTHSGQVEQEAEPVDDETQPPECGNRNSHCRLIRGKSGNPNFHIRVRALRSLQEIIKALAAKAVSELPSSSGLKAQT
ncbi:hypothetical protein F2Q69_00016396 [Brassica cretica]|uniref:Uncharacterized protein n=1 Tax=Brassica cretica TaxID=69181 RepID=A0A8S9QKL9_BRACR|nr:hypothetical protein F2Q69_00016396 [Brassica cretica]